MGVDGRLARGVVVRRLLAVAEASESGAVSALHVRVAAEAAGVSPRTVWHWLAAGRAGRVERLPKPSFSLPDAWWTRLAEEGGNVSAVYRRMTEGEEKVDFAVPSLGTVQRAVKRDVQEGRVLEVASVGRGRVEV
ncbi:ATP-binding protein, partial [Streptomyces sp. NPDC091371]